MHINLSEFRILTGALFFMLTGSVHAGIQISPMNISLNNQDEYSGTVSFYSTSTETQYIKVTVKKIIFSGTSQQKEISALPGDDEILVVSPQSFILSPQRKHIVRLLPLNVPQKEKVYRVYVSSVPDDAGRETVNNNARITINVIWGVLVYVEPENSTVLLSYDSKTGILINHGNRHIRVSDYGFCSS
ncbi:fimbria/pilus periplasmic chaperone [Salmonella enterica]|nr:fimbria/pilus periplasmic chaperone [Salmonella enterica]